MTPTIICAIEKRTAERVARAGGELARELGAKIVLAHVREDPPLFLSRADRERARNRSTRQGARVLRRARQALPAGVAADERVELGIAAPRLTEIAKEMDAALVVVGTRGLGRLAAAVVGSVSQALVRQAPCPVMIVPPTPALGSLRHPTEPQPIVVGLDAADESLAVATLARELASRVGARLVAVYTDERVDPIDSSTAPGPPAHMLQAAAAREAAGLVVIGANLGDSTRFPLAPSVATQLPRLVHCPIVVLPEGVAGTLGSTRTSDARRAA
jgi:nucleotide-binding universal stress UspA family protein